MNATNAECQWYVLFVKTGYEHKSVIEILRGWQEFDVRPFVPTRDYYFKHSGGGHWEKVRMFPGYVFVESTLTGIDFFVKTKPLIMRSDIIYKPLRYLGVNSGEFVYEMKEEERNPLQKLFNYEYCIEKTCCFFEGDKIVFLSGAFEGFNGSIQNINLNKKRAVIDVKFMGEVRKVTVGLELIEKLPL